MGTADGFGPPFIGGLVSAMLYGITTLQIYTYYMHYSRDALTIKFLVIAIWILDTLHSLFVCHILYYYLITNYGIPTSFEYIAWSLPASFLANVFMVSAVQCFFAHQIYHLCRPRVKWLVTAPIILFILAQFGFGMVEAVVLGFVNRDASISTHIRFYAASPSMVAVTLAEVLITVSLCVLLRNNGSSLTFRRTKRLLNTVIVYAVNRCLLTSLVAIGELATAVEVQNTWSMALSFVIGKLYANSLLASLNCRDRLRSQGAGTLSDLPASAIHFENPLKLPGDIESSKGGARQFEAPDVAVINITTNHALE